MLLLPVQRADSCCVDESVNVKALLRTDPENVTGPGEVEEAEVVGADSFPAHEQPAEAVVPGVGPLHDPTRLALDAAQERLLADAPDVRRDPVGADGGPGRRGPRDARRTTASSIWPTSHLCSCGEPE